MFESITEHTIYGGNMRTHLKKVFVVLGATLVFSGCSLTKLLNNKDASSNVNPTPSPTPSSQTNTAPTTEMGSQSYKVESSSPNSSSKEDEDLEDIQKDLDSVSMEGDFGLLVQ